MSNEQIPPEIDQKAGKKGQNPADPAALPHDMIARTLCDYITTLYDIDNFSVLPGTADDFYALKLEASDDTTLETLKNVIDFVKGLPLEIPATINEEMTLLGFESLDDFIPLLKAFDNAIAQTIFDQEKSDQQPLPAHDDFLHAVKKGDDPFVFHLISDNRHFSSDSDLAANMLENFKIVAGMHETYIPPSYSIDLIRRAIATANNPRGGSSYNFWLH